MDKKYELTEIEKEKEVLALGELDKGRVLQLIKEFSEYPTIAEALSHDARLVVINDNSTTADMDNAKNIYKTIRDIQIKIEKTRKEYKEKPLREGQAIDKVARILKDFLSPAELYLKSQVDYFKIKAQKEEQAIREEADRLYKEQEAVRIEKERIAREEQIKIQAEQALLARQAQEKERAEEQARQRAIKLKQNQAYQGWLKKHGYNEGDYIVKKENNQYKLYKLIDMLEIREEV